MDANWANVGKARVVDAADYEMGDGFVIELCYPWGGREPSWAIPAWDERGEPHLEGVFTTRNVAEAALAE